MTPKDPNWYLLDQPKKPEQPAANWMTWCVWTPIVFVLCSLALLLARPPVVAEERVGHEAATQYYTHACQQLQNIDVQLQEVDRAHMQAETEAVRTEALQERARLENARSLFVREHIDTLIWQSNMGNEPPVAANCLN